MEIIAPFGWLILAAFIAGLVDAVVGGGGLVQIPALFAAQPGAAPATLFGTNKFASVFGTANAAWRYARRVEMPWRTILPAALAAFALSYAGAAAVAWLPKDAVRPLILFLLIFAAGYTLLKKDFGQLHRPAHSGRRELAYAVLLGGVIGFYDGFFGFDFLHASAGAKVVNVATNLAALAFFLPAGHIIAALAGAMAVANIAGSVAGTWLALRHGSGFIRIVFLVVVGVLIVKFAWDTFAGV